MPARQPKSVRHAEQVNSSPSNPKGLQRKQESIAVTRIVTILVAAALVSGCAGMMRPRVGLEQEAISNAMNLCKKFGHKVDTPDFTRCAEQRYDEYMVNHR